MTFPAAPCKLMKSIEKESQSRSFTSLQMVNTHTHTLAQKCLIELLMWNASFVSKKTSIKLARPNKGIGRICHRNPNHFLGAVSTNQSYTRSFYIDVFSRDGQDGFDISRRCGLLLHGDEGRSLRKQAILILSCHSILRYGIRTSCSTRKISTN